MDLHPASGKRPRASKDDSNNPGIKAAKARRTGVYSSGYRYVYKAGKRWQTRVKRKSEVYYVGVYDSAIEGARAADFKVRQLGWPSSLLNFPNEETAAPEPAAVGRINDHPQPNKNKLGYKGVFIAKTLGSTRYYVQVWKNGKSFRVRGTFPNMVSAARAFDKKAVYLGRTASYLNFPDDYAKYKAELAAIDSSDEESESEGEGSSGASARSKAIASLPPDSSDEEEEGDEEEGQQDKGGEEEEVIGRGQRIVMAV